MDPKNLRLSSMSIPNWRSLELLAGALQFLKRFSVRGGLRDSDNTESIFVDGRLLYKDAYVPGSMMMAPPPGMRMSFSVR